MSPEAAEVIQQHEWNKGCTIGGNVLQTSVDVCMNIMLRGAATDGRGPCIGYG